MRTRSVDYYILGAAFCSTLLLGGCRALGLRPHPDSSNPPAETSHDESVHRDNCMCNDSDVDELLSYHHAVRQMSPIEINKTIAGLNHANPSARGLVQKAMLTAGLHGSGDLARAQALLEQVLSSNKPDAERLKPLASLLNATYGEWRKSDDNAEKYAQQLRDEQHRSEQLNDKLEALKNIERSLQTRPAAQGAAGTVDSAKP